MIDKFQFDEYRSMDGEENMFMDIIGPVLLVLFTGLALWGILGYLQKDLYPLIVGAVAELFICYIFGFLDWKTTR